MQGGRLPQQANGTSELLEDDQTTADGKDEEVDSQSNSYSEQHGRQQLLDKVLGGGHGGHDGAESGGDVDQDTVDNDGQVESWHLCSHHVSQPDIEE